MTTNIYNLFSKIFSYPEKDTVNAVFALITELEKNKHDEAVKYLKVFHDYYCSVPLDSLRESYTSTYDVQAVCPLDVGYTLFGEDYKRGEFLVRMSALHKENKVAVNPLELGDHLTNILLLLEQMNANHTEREFVEKLILPANKKMLENFKNPEEASPFSRPLFALYDFLNDSYKLNSKVLEVSNDR